MPFPTLSHLDPDALVYEAISQLAERLMDRIAESGYSAVGSLRPHKSADLAALAIEPDDVCFDRASGHFDWIKPQVSIVSDLDPDSLAQQIVSEFP
jgi:hypothetical protein